MKSLIDEGWDEIDLNALLPLVGVRTMSTEFGFLFRPYWMPDTTLQYEETTEQHFPGGETVDFQRRFTKEMKRCTADSCLWRERTLEFDRPNKGLIHFSPLQLEDHFCEYDSSAQTFRIKKDDSSDPWPQNEQQATDLALLRQALIAPLPPIPLGFRWNVRSKNGHLDFTLESLEKVGDMTVLFIRRQGKLSINEFYRFGNAHPQRYIVERSGLTVYALERSAILEDRVYDVVRSAGPTTTLENLETLTIHKLTKSFRGDRKRAAPLHLKYETKKKLSYIYDVGTGRILEVDPVIYSIVDDFGVLPDNKLVEKHESLGTEKVETAIQELDVLRKRGHLLDHPPTELSRVDLVQWNEKMEDVEIFCRTKSTLLVLSLTERCNLQCEYCCYSGKFDGQRTHGTKTMSLEIARKAISAFLDNELVEGRRHAISFYGGEPLLESHLLQECVRFAVEYSQSLGKEVQFAVTTNGTLLDDEAVDYLVEHDFLVMVSLDGPKESHDRYRTFSNGGGSFDIVVENLRRFAERYPGYPNRGLSITLAPPLCLEETAKVIEEFHAAYPFTRTSLVNTGPEYRFLDEKPSSMQYGCNSKQACQKSVEIDAFRLFGDEDRKQLQTLWKDCVESLTRNGAAETWKCMPFAMTLFLNQLEFIHRRPVTKTTPNRSFYIPCVPGVTRRFVDASGNYRICERVDGSEAYRIGDVFSGLDETKIRRTMEFRRHLGDCGNCTALKTCDICYAVIPHSDAIENGFDPEFGALCHRKRETTLQLLQTYTGIMEKNPVAFESPSDKDIVRTKKPRYGTDEPDMSPETATRIQCESF